MKRTEATIEGPEGKFKVTKGATHIILDLCSNKDAIHDEVDAKVTEYGMRGIRCMAVARTDPKPELPAKDDWKFIGVLTFLDPPRFDTKLTIEQAMENGVDVKMVTGDNVLIARETARVLGMGTNISTTEGLPSMNADGSVPNDLHKTHGPMILEADGFAQVFPEHKYLIVEALRQAGFAVGMTGDGVNDAPALKRADVGIAVSGATDAARAAADIVLTEPGLNTVVHAMIVARQIFRRINNFINYRVGECGGWKGRMPRRFILSSHLPRLDAPLRTRHTHTHHSLTHTHPPPHSAPQPPRSSCCASSLSPCLRSSPTSTSPPPRG